MTPARNRFFFDFVDPLSYLADRELTAAEEASGVRIERIGFELRPPPAPLTGVDDPIWSDRWLDARRVAEELGVALAPPWLVPWSRKAHELHLLAAEHDRAGSVRTSLFEAYFTHGRDIGRIDELVKIAGDAGLDRTETKAALDVDRLREEVAGGRLIADALGVDDVPVLMVGDALVEGFPNRQDLSTLLGGPANGR